MGQVDREFWFAAPDITIGHTFTGETGSLPIRLVISSQGQICNVRISQPANPGFATINVVVPAGNSSLVNLSNFVDLIENNIPNSVSNKGLLIESDNLITCYYEVDNTNNRDIFPLKGNNALGVDFIAPMQTSWPNGSYTPQPYSIINIVAISDGTSVTITPTSNAVGRPQGVPFTVTLNRGQVYTLTAAQTTAGQHLGGTSITSDAPIAVTITDDSVHPTPNSCKDIVGDQLVHTGILGTKYLVMRGRVFLNPANSYNDLIATGERIYIYATEDNTSVLIDGIATPVLNRGQSYAYEISKNATPVIATKKVYVLHVAGFGCELGGAILPPTENCTGSTEVSFYRSDRADEGFFINLMVRKGAEHRFLVTAQNGDTARIDATWFEENIATGWMVLKNEYKQFPLPTGGSLNTINIQPGQVTKITNDLDYFHLGVINGTQSRSCKYGYFSSYNMQQTEAVIAESGSSQINYCYGDTATLTASGGISYRWEAQLPENNKYFVTDPNKSSAKVLLPPGIYKFNVFIGSRCFPEVKLSVEVNVAPFLKADYSLFPSQGCSPLNVTFINKSIGDTKATNWFIDNPNIKFNPTGVKIDTIEYVFENKTDQPISYLTKLKIQNSTCHDSMLREILIYPEISAGFTHSPSQGCQPLPVDFTSTATGTLSSVRYEFGDGGSSYDLNPQRTFINTTNQDIDYITNQIVTSPYNCKDTAQAIIKVYPFIEAVFTVDTVNSCSPLVANIKNGSRGKIDTYNWNFGDGNTGSQSQAAFPYNYENNTAATITRDIRLIVSQGSGCADTMVRTMTVHPSIVAQFTQSKLNGCSPLQVGFSATNNIVPGVSYLWEFGNKSSSAEQNPIHTYVNYGLQDSIFKVKLTVESPQKCKKTAESEVTVYEHIDAAFAIDSAVGCAQLPVKISNLSTGGIAQYSWDFGDGVTFNTASKSVNPYKYTNIGNTPLSRLLRLVVRNDNNCTDTFERPLTINPEVVSKFISSVTSGCDPLQVSFTNLTSNIQGSTTKWDFGDGTSSSSANINTNKVFRNLTFSDKIYGVKLISQSPFNCVDTATIDITVGSYIDADFKIDTSFGCSPMSVGITNSSIGGAGIQFNAWDFGDGTRDTLGSLKFNQSYTNLTNADQSRNIKLTVINGLGCKDSITKPITVYPEANASFTADVLQGCQPLQVQFSNLSSLGSTMLRWDFGDGGSTGVKNPSNLFVNLSSNDTTFNVTLNALTNKYCSNDTTIPITVYAFIEADFKIPENELCAGYDIRFVNDARGGIDTASYFWDFNNDGNTDANTNNSVFYHMFQNTSAVPLNYVVEQKVKNNHECYDSITREVKVFPEVIADFSMDTLGCSPFTVPFTNTTLNARDYNWYFGTGGSTSSEKEPTQIFTNTNIVDVLVPIRLIAVSEYQCADTLDKTIYLNHKPKADFRLQGFTNMGCAPFDAVFDNRSLTSSSTFYWTYGDDTDTITYDQSETVQHFYRNLRSTIRSYKVQLLAVTDQGCRDSVDNSIFVYPEVVAAFVVDTISCSPFPATFSNQTINAYRYKWDFGDSTTSVQSDPAHLYSNDSTINKEFNVSLIGYSKDGCVDTTNRTIVVLPTPIASFGVTPIYQRFPAATVNITNRTNDGDFIYVWSFGDDSLSLDKNPAPYTYQHWGQYFVELSVSNDYCRDSARQDIEILPPLPLAAFDSSVRACPPIQINFVNNSQYANTYFWDFDDGTTSDEFSPSKIFTKPGKYNIQLIVDGEGGRDATYQTIEVFDVPIAEFDLAPRDPRLPDAKIKCSNLTKYGYTYLWEFGDGNTSEEKNPLYKYDIKNLTDSKEKLFDVYLYAWSENGCVDTAGPVEIKVGAEGYIRYPNAFTPITTGSAGGNYQSAKLNFTNDVFYPVYKNVDEENYQLEIYSRWGELLFRTEDILEGWDGYYLNKLCKQDVYVFKAKGKFLDGRSFEIAGDVTLLHRADNH